VGKVLGSSQVDTVQQRMIKRRSRALGWRSDEQDFGKTPPPLSQLAGPPDISTDESF
jgi:hypothetical protein